MDDIIKTRDSMLKIIIEVGALRKEIETKGMAKAKAISDYDRKLAVTLATLKDGETYTLGDKTYKQPPVTIMEKIAKGICANERYELELAESSYKACISNIEALKAQLNGFQSINRHLDET